jgi:hypothetical protein
VIEGVEISCQSSFNGRRIFAPKVRERAVLRSSLWETIRTGAIVSDGVRGQTLEQSFKNHWKVSSV